MLHRGGHINLYPVERQWLEPKSCCLWQLGSKMDGTRLAIDELEANGAVRVILLTGEPAFCAGADIGEMQEMDTAEALAEDFSGCCDRLASCTKPVVAAVEGYAVGGGCELIEMCDIVVAAADARFRPSRDHARHPLGRGRDSAPSAEPGRWT
jgi:hypothetical protein